MSDNVAVLDGFTSEVVIRKPGREFPALVKPGTDYTDTFTVWDMDNQEYIRVDPWRVNVTTGPIHTPWRQSGP